MKTNNNRRNFVKKLMLGGLGVSAANIAPLGLMQSAFAASTSDSYKALVCVFLYGGNDSSNMIVPISGQQRINYENWRGGLSVANPLELNLGANAIEGGLGLNPQMTKLHTLFEQGKVAIQANVGTEVGDLFAHNAQQEAWQRGAELKYSKGHGWAGKMLEAQNGSSAPHYLQNVSLYGHTTWSSGIATSPFSIGANNIPKTALYHHHQTALDRKSNLENHFKKLSHSDHVLMKEYAKTILNTETHTLELSDALAKAAPITGFGSSNLSQQLKRVLEVIKIQQSLGLSLGRQIFFVGLSGFDTHKAQEAIQKNGVGFHSNLLATLSNSLHEFYSATELLGLQDNITAFTMSEFGRTLTVNTGGGCDHGWGGHQLVVGGAVNGGLYGSMPNFASNSDDLLGKGILKPSTHAEQMTGGLAAWFGLNNNNLQEIFPLLKTENSINYFS